MSRYVFVPLTDEILYEHPELIKGPIVPYRPGWPCHHWLSVELNPDTDPPVKPKPRPQPAYRLELVGAGSHSH
jgi:hypothetical protein